MMVTIGLRLAHCNLGQTGRTFAVLSITAFLSACAPQASQQDFASFRSAVGNGNYKAAAEVATVLAKPQADGKGTELLWTLNAGAAELQAGNPARSIVQLDAAEQIMTAADAKSLQLGSGYRFGGYDAVMVNTYKTMAMLSSRDPNNARVESNRAYDQAQRVVQRFQAEINADKDRVEKQRREDRSNQEALASANADPAVRYQLQQLEKMGSYKPFVNPAAEYIRSVMLLNSTERGDAESARNGFQRVGGIVGLDGVVKGDLALATEAATKGKRPGTQVWVVFEDGQSPIFQQMNITVPMPVAARGGGVTARPVTVSLPKLVPQPTAYAVLNVEAGSARATTTSIGSIEAVMASEFRQRYPSLVAAAVFEAVAKAVGISVVNASVGKRAGAFGLLADVAATAAANVTSSDTRSWYLLPREFQAARLAMPANGEVTLRAAGGPSQTVKVQTDRPCIIHVKAQDPGSPLVYQVYRL